MTPSTNKSPRRIDLSWALGIGNFIVVTLVGAYFSWRTHDLESRLSTAQTAGQYIAIIANEEAPDYAKTLALSAIFHQGLISRDLLLETAYRIEDDSLERTIVGPLLYEVAGSESPVASPFGFVDRVQIDSSGGDGGPRLTVRGWGVDDQGWAEERESDRGFPMLHIDLGGVRHCTYPSPENDNCTVRVSRRPDVGALFVGYRGALESGFEATFDVPAWSDGWRLLTIRLIDRQGNPRIIYSRCIEHNSRTDGQHVAEVAFAEGRCPALDQKPLG